MSHRIHWRAPTTIAVAFVAGLAFAIGHDAFYRQLDRQPVDDALFEQQTNIAIGTAFAFLFRASLIIAVGAVYWQVFWGTMLRVRRPIAVSHVDALSGALGSLLELANLRAMMRSPTLAALALLSWLTPLAALFPPAALAVASSSHTTIFQDHIPVLNLSSNTMFQVTAPSAHGAAFSHITDTSPRLARLMTDTAHQGRMMYSYGYITNTSYMMQFSAPGLRCQQVVSEDLNRFQRYMESDCRGYNYTKNNFQTCGLDELDLVYYAWAPPPTRTPEGYLDDWRPPLRGSPGNTIEPGAEVGSYGARHVFVATRKPWWAAPTSGKKDWKLVNCSLHHATYTAGVSTHMDALSIISNVTVDFHDYVNGSIKAFNHDEVPTSDGYYVMMMALTNNLIGYILDVARQTQWITAKSSIVDTTLMFTSEMIYSARLSDMENNYTVDDIYREAPSLLPDGALSAPTFNGSLAAGIEELFQNMTLSLFSQQSFLKSSNETTNVTRERWLNIYTYRQKNLLLSYGIGIGAVLLACILGAITIYHNGASYSNQFSTILRTTRIQLDGFDDVLTTRDRSGADPLPKHVASARLELGRSKTTGGSSGSGTPYFGSQQRLDGASEQSVMLDRLQGNEGLGNVEGHDGTIVEVAGSERPRESRRSSLQISEADSVRDAMIDWPTSEQWRQIAEDVDSHGSI